MILRLNDVLDEIKPKKYGELSPDRFTRCKEHYINRFVDARLQFETQLHCIVDWFVKRCLFETDVRKEEETFSPPPDRGLYISGSTGTGKTTSIKLLAARTKSTPDYFYFSVPQIAEEYGADGEEFYTEFRKENNKRTVILDDLGAEREIRRFGNTSIIPDLLTWRYDCFKRNGIPTIVISNLLPSELKERYGERNASRFAEMMQLMPITGKDKRIK
ncbi:hypothetical protein FACS189419_04830 [Planctomycetales bacterium]|nr:hypothetical protein FACS189419_04830 [Planctomycetales bacterium]